MSRKLTSRADLVPVGHAGFPGHVRERAVALVAKQHLGPEVGNIQVASSIVVVVADRHTQPVAGPAHLRLFRHIFKPKSAQIAIQHVPAGKRIGAGPAQRSPIEEVDVHQTVVVVVEGRQSRGGDFDEVILLRAAVRMLISNLRVRRCIAQARSARRSAKGSWAAGRWLLARPPARRLDRNRKPAPALPLPIRAVESTWDHSMPSRFAAWA